MGVRQGIITNGLNHLGNHIFKFTFNEKQIKKIWDAYPKASEINRDELFKIIGGSLKDWYNEVKSKYTPNDAEYYSLDNTCALRLSRALNYSDFEIPNGTPNTYKGGDNKNYFITAKAITKYLSKLLGAPKKVAPNSRPFRGIITQTGFGGGVTGHVDVFYYGKAGIKYYETETKIWQ